MGWIEFSLAMMVFLFSHALPVRPPIKPWFVDRLGVRGFTLAYSAASIVILIWIIRAASRAPFVELWATQSWMVHATMTVMGLVCILLALSVAAPNPFSFGGMRNASFDPQKPGVVRFVRHPLLLALSLWSFAHLLVNGDLAHMILFGVFGAFALAGGKLINARRKRRLADSYNPLLAEAKKAPKLHPWPNAFVPIRRAALGVLIYGVMLWLHGPVIGVYLWL